MPRAMEEHVPDEQELADRSLGKGGPKFYRNSKLGLHVELSKKFVLCTYSILFTCNVGMNKFSKNLGASSKF
jgi:hypothetical protein